MNEENKSVDSSSVRTMLASNEATAIDIRDAEAWKSGHVPGARRPEESEIEEGLEEIADDQTVIIVCEDGEASAAVAERLAGEGDREFVSLEGGMESWRSDDMPMQPSTDPDDDVPI